MNAAIHKDTNTRGRRRRRQASGPVKSPLWRFSSDYLLLFLVLASHRSYEKGNVVALDPETLLPSVEATFDASESGTYYLDISSNPTGYAAPTVHPTIEASSPEEDPPNPECIQDSDCPAINCFVAPCDDNVCNGGICELQPAADLSQSTSQPTFLPSMEKTQLKTVAPTEQLDNRQDREDDDFFEDDDDEGKFVPILSPTQSPTDFALSQSKPDFTQQAKPDSTQSNSTVTKPPMPTSGNAFPVPAPLPDIVPAPVTAFPQVGSPTTAAPATPPPKPPTSSGVAPTNKAPTPVGTPTTYYPGPTTKTPTWGTPTTYYPAPTTKAPTAKSPTTAEPTPSPTEEETEEETDDPTVASTPEPTTPEPTTTAPTGSPTSSPTAEETDLQTPDPTVAPTAAPTRYIKTALPTSDPSNEYTPVPTMVVSNRQDTPGPAASVPIQTKPPTPQPTPSFEPVLTAEPTDPPVNFPPTEPPTFGTKPPITDPPLTTPEPTESPVATPRPSREPTTRAPTANSPRPSGPPTDPPTPSPTKAPSKGPTPWPTRPPTLPPTDTPTLKPTRRPTDPPTTSPSSQPSPSPTDRPTPFPTRAPVPWPTPFPTPLPTAPPTTAQPTPRPTGSPTTQPSSAPSIITPPPTTLSPSEQPSPAPSQSPTISAAPTTETPKPTVSASPSYAPSASPTDLPSSSPTDLPSTSPSVMPSNLPSNSPSQAPSLSLQDVGERVVMTLRYSDILEGLSIITWEQITATHIRQSIVNAGVEPPMDDLRVWTNIVKQNPELGLNAPGATIVPQATAILAPAASPTGVRRRSLQAQEEEIVDGNVPLKIAFDTAVSYRSAGQDHDIQVLISGAFDTEEDRAEYVNSLKRTNDGAFQNLQEVVSVSVGGVIIPEEEEKVDEGRDMTIFIIIGAAAGGGALLLLILFLFWRRYVSLNQRSTMKTESGTAHHNPHGVTTEILVEHNPDEVSTLGDPMYTPNGMTMGLNTMEREEERTASVGDDYDYKYLKHHNFSNNEDSPRDGMMSDDARSRVMSEESMTRESSGKTGSQSKLGLSQMGESIFSDDASFEEQYTEPDQQVPFEITVPAGKLGMVIDTPNGGFPIVHAIKDTSILADKVLVGDRLVSVDGQDCTTMTAVQVSKLISLKSEQESRVLVFVRNRVPRPGANQ